MNYRRMPLSVTRDSRIQSVFHVDRNHRELPSTPRLNASYSTKWWFKDFRLIDPTHEGVILTQVW